MAAAVAASLRYAVDLWRQPERHAGPPYGAGARAYDNWEAAVRAGHGSSHGNWWTATVWSECRTMAGQYLAEVAPILPLDAEGLADEYAAIGERLQHASDKELAAEPKLALLAEARGREARDSERSCTRRWPRWRSTRRASRLSATWVGLTT